uniref:Uncharacterized protein n=1 Tax=Nelumbo nucifera TaxID=4432 RepID=A0A822XUC9_NELNU|nr:TPA_asm: hypothetical protein HUJ06_024172 [Nelumbo nucifera]
MAASESSLLEYWRGFFGGTGFDIFTIIERAIKVAALDRPEEFGMKRERLMEKILSLGVENKSSGSKSVGYDKTEIKVIADADCKEKKVDSTSKDASKDVVKAKETKDGIKTKTAKTVEPMLVGDALSEKINASKRKLHEGYRIAENAKKRHCIKVLDLRNLPEQTVFKNNTHPRAACGKNTICRAR